MQRGDADISLIAVWLNNVKFEQPVDDPLFAAHHPKTYIVGGGYPNYTRYKTDFAAGVIGCAQQVSNQWIFLRSAAQQVPVSILPRSGWER